MQSLGVQTESAAAAAPARDAGSAPADSGAELARGAVLNTIALLASNLRGIFTFLIARLLGKAALGTFSLAWSTTDLLSKLGTFGLDNGVLAHVARKQTLGDPAGAREVFRQGVRWGLFLSAATALAGAALLGGLGEWLGQPPELTRATSFMLIALPGLALYRVSTNASRGLKVMDHDIYSRGLTEPFGSTLAFLAAVVLGLDALAPVVGAFVGTAASGMVAFVLARRLFRRLPQTPPSQPVAGALLRFSAPIALYSLLNILIMRLDVILLGMHVGRVPGVTLETLGIYGAAVELGSALRKVSQAFNPIFAPVVAGHALQRDTSAMQTSFAYLGRWLLAIVLPVLALLAMSGSAILRIYGPGFERGGAWLALIAVACGTNAFVGLAETVIMVQHPKLNLINSSVTVVISVLANLALIPWLGPTGAALGMVIPYTLQGILRYGELRVLYGWQWPWRAFVRPVLASTMAVVPALPVRFLVPGLAGQAAAAVVLSGCYLLAWKLLGLDAQDRAILRQLRAGRSV